MTKFKIVLTDSIFPDQEIERQEVEAAGGTFVLSKSGKEDDIIAVAHDADAIVSTYAEVTRKVIEATTNCKIIVRSGIGFNNIDLNAASEKGIYVCNVPDYCFDEVADHTLALALALARKVVLFDRKVKKNEWTHDGARPIFGLRGQTWGMLGFGNIPRNLLTKVLPFGFKVLVYDPFIKPEYAAQFDVEMVDLDRLFRESDILSVHAPLTDDTKNVVNAENLRKMKPNALVVNTSRGPLVCEPDLYTALKENWITGAAIDVMVKEPPEADNPLLTLDNIIITPHAAFYSEDSSIALRHKSFQEAVRGAKGETPLHPVNLKQLAQK